MSGPRSVPSPTPGHERRAHLRVDVLGQVEVHSVWKLQPVSLREISATGFSLEATAPFETGTVHKFRISSGTGHGQGRSVVVQARVSYCTLTSASTGLAIYSAGFEVVALNDHATRELSALVEYASELWTAE